jgi:hypothetical protein
MGYNAGATHAQAEDVAMLQNFLRRPNPAAPAQPEPLWRRQVNNIIETQIARYPLLVQFRAISRQLGDERAIWPYLIPLLVVVFAGTYRAERKRVLQAIAALREQ